MKRIQFFFDPISPYGWLASKQIPAFKAKTGAQFEFIPILFAALLDENGQKGPAEIPSKREYFILDVMRG